MSHMMDAEESGSYEYQIPQAVLSAIANSRDPEGELYEYVESELDWDGIVLNHCDGMTEEAPLVEFNKGEVVNGVCTIILCIWFGEIVNSIIP